MATEQREYKDRLFTFIFGREEHKDWTLSLYNAVNGTSYSDPSVIEFNTIEDVLYLGMHNDVSFLIADEMSLFEQQSTYNPNMPLRMLQYLASLYEKDVKLRHLSKYGHVKLVLPVPRFVVFYNGKEEKPDEMTLQLSDLFAADATSDVEVCVHMYNINEGFNPRLAAACEPLREYAWTVKRIRENMESKKLGEAIDATLKAMPSDFVLQPYLMAHKAEVKGMLLTEYNEAEEMELLRESYKQEWRGIGQQEGRAKGREEGREEGREVTLLESLGSLMRTLPCTAERAMDLLGVPDADRDRLLEKLGAVE